MDSGKVLRNPRDSKEIFRDFVERSCAGCVVELCCVELCWSWVVLQLCCVELFLSCVVSSCVELCWGLNECF